MKIVLSICLSIIMRSHFAYGQYEFVANGGFDTINPCVCYGNEIWKASPWFQPLIFIQNDPIPSSSTDLYSMNYSCAASSCHCRVPDNMLGFQYPRSGSGYAGIFVGHYQNQAYEFIEAPLRKPLKAGVEYCVEFYVSLSNFSTISYSNLGVYFSEDSLLVDAQHIEVDHFVPQIQNQDNNMLNDTLNWMPVNGSFIASGGERFLTIGRFTRTTSTNYQFINSNNVYNDSTYYHSYYYIEDVSVIECQDNMAINEVSDRQLRIIPNPVQDLAILSDVDENVRMIQMYSVYGKLIEIEWDNSMIIHTLSTCLM